MGKSPEPHPVHEDPGLAGLEGLSQMNLRISETWWPCGKCRKTLPG